MTLLYDIQSLLERYLTKLVRNPTLLATNLLTPLLFLFLFSQLLPKFSIFPGVSGNYLAYLTPGIVMLNAMISAPQGGVSIANDRFSGFWDLTAQERAPQSKSSPHSSKRLQGTSK